MAHHRNGGKRAPIKISCRFSGKTRKPRMPKERIGKHIDCIVKYVGVNNWMDEKPKLPRRELYTIDDPRAKSIVQDHFKMFNPKSEKLPKYKFQYGIKNHDDKYIAFLPFIKGSLITGNTFEEVEQNILEVRKLHTSARKNLFIPIFDNEPEIGENSIYKFPQISINLPETEIYSSDQVKTVLKKNGYAEVRENNNYSLFYNFNNSWITLKNDDIIDNLELSIILHETGITIDQFRKILRGETHWQKTGTFFSIISRIAASILVFLAINAPANSFGYNIKPMPDIKEDNLFDFNKISGTVVDSKGKGLSGKVVEMYTTGVKYKASTDNNGNFSFLRNVNSVDGKITLPSSFGVTSNYPNPFNPSTNVDFDLPDISTVDIKVYDILGKVVKNVFNDKLNAGSYTATFDLNGKANGVYFVMVNGKDSKGNGFNSTKKIMLEYGTQHNNSSSEGVHAKSLNYNNEVSKENLTLKKVTNETIDSIVVKEEKSLVSPTQGKVLKNISVTSSDMNIGNISIDEYNVLKVGPVYEIDTTTFTIKPIPNLKVSLGSEPNNFTFTDANGNAVLYTAKLGKDSVFVTDTNKIFYNWKNAHKEIVNEILVDDYYTIQNGTNIVKALNDDNGIQLIRRFRDENGIDLLDKLVNMADVRNNLFPQDPIINQTIIRIRSPTITVYMNRSTEPRAGYADACFAGMKSWETKGISITEVSDSTNADIKFRYTNSNIGNTYYYVSPFDENGHKGYYVKKGTVINMAGLPNPLPNDYAISVSGHESGHALFGSPWHDPSIKYIMFGAPIARKEQIGSTPTKLEKLVFSKIYLLPEGTKLMYLSK